MSQFPQRPASHIAGDEAIRQFLAACPKEWVPLAVDRDYGIDLRIEISRGGAVTGEEFYVQVKPRLLAIKNLFPTCRGKLFGEAMSKPAIDVLTEIAVGAKEFAAQYKLPQVPPFRFKPHHQHIQALSTELAAVPEIAKWEKQQIATFSSIGEIHFSYLAASMAERVVDGVPPSEVFADLMDLLAKQKADIYVIMGVSGISIQGAFEIGSGVRLVPPAKLPPTKAREDMFDLDRDGVPLHRGSIVSRRVPTTALVIDGTMTVIHGAKIDPTERKKLTDDVILKQDRTLTCLTLSGKDCAPFVAYSSSWINHPAYSYSGWGLVGYGSFHGVAPHKDGAVDSELAKAVYAQLIELKTTDWPAVQGATDRLRRSRSHLSDVDRAIDLGIALEMTLLHELKDRDEKRYRSALRGAWLLAKSGPDRRVIFKALRAAYDARSSAVHTGKLSNKPLIDNLPEADGFCADAIRSIINRGEFPGDWESLVMDDSSP